MTEQSTGPLANMSAAELAAMTAEATGWQPQDGDELQGTVVAIKSAWSEQKNANYPIVFVLRDDMTCVAVHCFQTILENEVKSQRPLPGEPIYIKRIGEGKAKPGQSAPIRYAVHVTRDQGTSDPWASM